MAHRPSDGRPRRSNRTGSRYLSRAPCYHVKAPSRIMAYNFHTRARTGETGCEGRRDGSTAQSSTIAIAGRTGDSSPCFFMQPHPLEDSCNGCVYSAPTARLVEARQSDQRRLVAPRNRPWLAANQTATAVRYMRLSSPSVDKREEHYRRLVRTETLRRIWRAKHHPGGSSRM
jgi:hypothetical protein